MLRTLLLMTLGSLMSAGLLAGDGSPTFVRQPREGCSVKFWNAILDLSQAPSAPVEVRKAWRFRRGVLVPCQETVQHEGVYMDGLQTIGASGPSVVLVIHHAGKAHVVRWRGPSAIANCGAWATQGADCLLKDCDGVIYRVAFR